MASKIKRTVIFRAIFFALIASIILILNLDVSIRQGVNGVCRNIKMPLYVKAVEFLSRHYQYERLVKEITVGCKTDTDKTLAIFNWTHNNIKQSIPDGVPIIDDHVLNIIIRRYGASDQSQDVFTTLCSYSGLPALWQKVYGNSGRAWYPISFVKIGGKWRVFDSYYGIYFLNKDGGIASVEDILTDKTIIEKADIGDLVYEGIPYKEFYRNIKPIPDKRTLRPDKQKPLKRLIFEIKRLLGVERQGSEVVNET